MLTCETFVSALSQLSSSGSDVFESFQISRTAIARRPIPALTPEITANGRRRWTKGDLMEAVTGLAHFKTSDIAKALGVNPKALRSVLRRNGISLRAIRENAKGRQKSENGGLSVRRPASGPSATYGASALVELRDNCCRWPIGDPSEPDFAFCGGKTARLRSYCQTHRSLAFERRCSNAG